MRCDDEDETISIIQMRNYTEEVCCQSCANDIAAELEVFAALSLLPIRETVKYRIARWTFSYDGYGVIASLMTRLIAHPWLSYSHSLSRSSDSSKSSLSTR